MRWLLILWFAFSPAASGDRTRSTLRMNEGIVLATKGDDAAALQAMKEATALDPTHARAHYMLAKLCQRQGKLADASKSLRSALEHAAGEQPLTLDIRYQLALVVQAMSDEPGVSTVERTRLLRQALVELDAVTAGDPARSAAHHRKGLALDWLGEPSAADDAYRACIAADPRRAACFVSLADLYADYGFFEPADAVLRAGLLVGDSSAELWRGVGALQARRGRFREAVEAYDKARSIDPDRADIYYGLGMAHADLGERAQAITALRKFIAIAGSDVPEAYKRAANDTIARMEDVL